MTTVKTGVWIFILLLVILVVVTSEFDSELTYLHVAIHISLLTSIYFALVFPPEDVLDGLGLTLFDLFTVLFDIEKYEFLQYICMRQSFFRAFVAFYPAVISAYFVHGSYYMDSTTLKRFPPLLEHPVIWSIILVVTTISTVVYYQYRKDCKRWPFYRYFEENPECLQQIPDLVIEPDTFRIKFSQQSYLFCTRQFFVYVSNWRFVAVRQSDLRLQVDATRMPRIPQPDDEERLRYIFVKVSFRQSYLPTFTVNLRHDYYRQLNEILEIPIIVPPHITIPLTIMEELKQDFIERVAQNDHFTYQLKRTEKEPCFACGTEENLIKIVKTCADNTERWQWNRSGHRVYTDSCLPCVCRPLWCHRCIAQIFIGKQNIEDIYRHDYWRGTSQCPTCRKPFCVRDVHLVDFLLEDD